MKKKGENMAETQKIGNVATRVLSVTSCLVCPAAAGFDDETPGGMAVLCQGGGTGASRRVLEIAHGGPPGDCPLRREALFVALAAAEVIK